MMDWPDQLPSLSDACKIAENEIAGDIKSLSQRVSSMKEKMKSDLKERLGSFIEVVKLNICHNYSLKFLFGLDGSIRNKTIRTQKV